MKILLLATLLTTTAFSFAQNTPKDNIKILKGITEYNLVFDYENVRVDKFDTEEDFLKDKMGKRERKHPGEGKGERFKKSWFSDREGIYEPKFIESFNKRFKKGEVKVNRRLENAKYTMKIKTAWISPGFNVGVARQNSQINAIITVYETANPDNILLTKGYVKVQGSGAMGYDYNSAYRISEAYAKLAKNMARFIKKGK